MCLNPEWHLKTGQICLVFKWLWFFRPFENWKNGAVFEWLTIFYYCGLNTNPVFSSPSKTGRHFVRFSNGFGNQMSGFRTFTVSIES
jgi:hypothetical protein